MPKLTLRRVIIFIMALGIFGYFLNDYIEERKRKKDEGIRVNNLKRSLEQSVSAMSSRHNAVTNWVEQLCKGESYRTETILTIELEKLWLDRPILFFGSIDDVATIDEKNYRLYISRSLMSNLRNVLFTELSVELKCDKKKVNQLLDNHPKIISASGLDNGIAVVAKINQIKTDYIIKEGNRNEVRIGLGDCLDVIYVGHYLY